MEQVTGFVLREYSFKEKKMNEQEIKYQKAKERVADLRGFYGHLSVYVFVNLGLFLINMTMSPEVFGSFGRSWDGASALFCMRCEFLVGH
jgi:hypothetical protein